MNSVTQALLTPWTQLPHASKLLEGIIKEVHCVKFDGVGRNRRIAFDRTESH